MIILITGYEQFPGIIDGILADLNPDCAFLHTCFSVWALLFSQPDIPLSYIKDFLGHVSATTTGNYASDDASMIKEALEKAAYQGNATSDLPIWADNENMILKICGLK